MDEDKEPQAPPTEKDNAPPLTDKFAVEVHPANEEDPSISFSHSNLEASSAPPLQLLNNESEFSGEITEMPEQILEESELKEEDHNELPLSVNIEDQLKEFDGSDDEGVASKEGHEPIENLVDALCDSESSKHGNETLGSAEVHSDGEEDSNQISSTDKDAFEEVDMSLVEKEKTTTSEENDVLSDDRTQAMVSGSKGDHTDDEGDESRTDSRMEVDGDDHEEHVDEDHEMSHDHFEHQDEEGTRDNDHVEGEAGDDDHHDEHEVAEEEDAQGERITPNNDDDDDEHDENKTSSSPTEKNNGEVEVQNDDEHENSNCVDVAKSNTPTDDLPSQADGVEITGDIEPMEVDKSTVENMDVLKDTSGNSKEIEKANESVGTSESAEHIANTRSRSERNKNPKNTPDSDAGNPSHEDNSSKMKTRVSRRLSPETVSENSKDKSGNFEKTFLFTLAFAYLSLFSISQKQQSPVQELRQWTVS